MIVLKHVSDLPRDHPAFSLAAEILPRIGPGQGYLVLITPEDLDRDLPLPELPTRLDLIDWEGVTRHPAHFHAVHLTNNEFAISFLIPDSVTGPLRSRLEEHL